MCKYFKKEMVLIQKMISFLYDDLEEYTGGLCHIVTDDNNINDENLKFVIEYADEPEHANRPDKNVSKYICQSMLELSLIEREFLFGLYNTDMDPEESLELLSNAGCIYEECNFDCPYKAALNKFHAEEECIWETGSNEKFLDGEWPIKNI